MPKETKLAKCPICGKPIQEKYRPFCSLHCADVDLGRWLKGIYATPSVESSDVDTKEEEEG